MRKLNLFFKSLKYSVSLVYRSSGFLILLYPALNLIGPTLQLSETFVIKLMLDDLLVPSPQIAQIVFYIALYTVILVAVQAVTSAQNYLYDTVFNKKAVHLYECELNQKLSELPLSFIDSSAGKNAVNDVRYTMNTAVFTTSRIISAVSYLYTFIVAYAVLFRFDILFSLLFLILTVPGVILNEIFDKKAEILRRKQAPDVRKFCYYRWMLTDAWPAKDVRMYDLTDPIKARYDEEKERYLSANKKLDKQKTRLMLFAEVIRRSGEIAFTVFTVYQAMRGQISIGDVALYTGYALTASNAFRQMLYILVIGYARSSEEMRRVFDFFAIKTETKGYRRSIRTFESLVFDNVYFKYPHTETYVLAGASFSVNKGDKLSIVGINGSGKSTIIKLMLGLYEIDAGQILLNGHPMSEYDIHEVRKLFSVLFQSFVQYPLTLRENIALSDLERIDKDAEIESALTQSGVAEELVPKLENGLDSLMTRQFDDRGTELSKGQWQKLALSRAYFKNAQVLIFDEPSAALDAEAEDRIFANFEAISDGKTGIMISHRISSARMSNKVIVLDGGKITEQGTHGELLLQNGLYAKLYNLQREKYT